MSKRRYRLRSSNTFAAVIVRNDDSKLLSRLGHDHVIRADEFTSTVAIDPDRPEDLRFALSFAVENMVVDADTDRGRAKLEGTVSEKDRKTTRKNMLAEDQLDAAQFGNIDFRVDGATTDHDGQWLLDACLNVRHQRHDFQFGVAINFSPNLQVSGRAELTHRELGLKPYKAPMGTLQNKEEMTFIVEVDAAPL